MIRTVCNVYLGENFIALHYDKGMNIVPPSAVLPIRAAGTFDAPMMGVNYFDWVVDAVGQVFAIQTMSTLNPMSPEELLRYARGSTQGAEAVAEVEAALRLPEPGWMSEARKAGWGPTP